MGVGTVGVGIAGVGIAGVVLADVGIAGASRNKYGIGSVWQKYCNGLTHSLQQHEKIRLKQLFHAIEILCILLSFRCQTSQPYSSAGKQ